MLWREPPIRGEERIKDVCKSVHMNQKALRLLEQIILAFSDMGCVVWEPFGGLCSTAIAALNTGRKCYSAEILDNYYKAALDRLANHDAALALRRRTPHGRTSKYTGGLSKPYMRFLRTSTAGQLSKAYQLRTFKPSTPYWAWPSKSRL